LTESEQRHLKLLLGPTAFAFTPNNPTGHHRLDLSLKEERDIGIKILDARNGNEQVLKEYTETVNARSGGPRDHFELCWLNAHLDGEVLQISPSSKKKDRRDSESKIKWVELGRVCARANERTRQCESVRNKV
jgi:hypothetical protein